MSAEKKPSLLEKLKFIRTFLKVAPGQIDDARKEIMELTASVNQINNRLNDYKSRFENIESVNPEFFSILTEKIINHDDTLCRLNRQLSNHPTLWGDSSRLHVSPLASVHTCFLNTNSGEIFIDDYTFAGSGVSILAGTHDRNLTGFLRRDAEITEGCNIRIGKGVWLASGCIVLGPCTIGDNAVIAAGAVVVPGSDIPANSIYGGIPAKCLGKLDSSPSGSSVSPAVLNALDRNDGKLFTEGWLPKEADHLPVPGYWLEHNVGHVLVSRSQWLAYYKWWDDASGGSILVSGSEGRVEIDLPDPSGSVMIHLPCGENWPEEVSLEKKKGIGRLMVGLALPDTLSENVEIR